MALKFNGRLARARQLAAGGNSNTETDVLRAGELGFVTDTGDLRVGDGTTAFSALKSVRNFRRIRVVTATGAAEINDEVIIVNAGGATTTSLPAAAASNAGRVIVVKNIGAGAASVAVTGGGNIDGSATNTAPNTQYATGRYLSNGTQWYTI